MNNLCSKYLHTGICKKRCKYLHYKWEVKYLLPTDILKVIFELLDIKSKNIFSSLSKKHLSTFRSHRKLLKSCYNDIWDTFDVCNEEVHLCHSCNRVPSIYDSKYQSLLNTCHVDGEWRYVEQVECKLHYSHKVECRYIVNGRDVNIVAFYLDDNRLCYIYE